MRLVFRCGHSGTFREGHAPCCRECGETGIARALAPPPRFLGACAGPVATTMPIEPSAACFVESRLVLKEGPRDGV